jgi:hypothetical protein
MGTRTIVTFHPDVECDVCGRRLLRGEQSDVFITGGQRRQVCELCTARATHEGWLRESDGHATSSRSARPQRGLSLFGRLRQSREARPERAPRGGSAQAGGTRGLYDFLDSSSPELAAQASGEALEEGLHYDDLGALEPLGGAHTHGLEGATADPAMESSVGQVAEQPSTGRGPLVEVAPTTGELKVVRALEVFNTSEQPRRVAGVARSLGVPVVRAAPVADSGSVVAIVVAWELCWYRYEVDLGDEAAGVRLAGQGMELDELTAEERVANAAADERGRLSLLSA